MRGAADDARGRRHAQRFRNLVAGLVIGGVITVLAALVLLLSPNVGGAAGAICSFAFLAVAFVAWEYLMKPGYGWLHRAPDLEREDEDVEEAAEPPTARKVPKSPRPR